MREIDSAGWAALDADVVRCCTRLIEFDTSNFGDNNARPERPAAEWVAGELSAVGYEPVLLEAAPGRANVVVRIAGHDPAAPGLLLHAHLDVVPAEAADWSFDPFAGDVVVDERWGEVVRGRGALDMKNTAAQMLALARAYAPAANRPPRDLVLAFVADEEDTGRFGAGYLVAEHPHLFDGVRTGIGESGGHSIWLPDGSRLYAIGAGERGSAWMRLTARGAAGHGSRPNPANAVSTMARTVAALADIEWPIRLTPPVAALLDGLQEQLSVSVELSDPQSLRQLGEAARLIETTMRNSLNPTGLAAGYKANVIPSAAHAVVDGRVLPGAEDEFFATLDAALGDVEREFLSWSPPVGHDHNTAEFAAMADAIRQVDSEAVVLPYCIGGGTDAKAFSDLGIDCYGFAPGSFPAGFTHNAYVHGVDEMIPVESLRVGARILHAYLQSVPHPQEDTP